MKNGSVELYYFDTETLITKIESWDGKSVITGIGEPHNWSPISPQRGWAFGGTTDERISSAMERGYSVYFRLKQDFPRRRPIYWIMAYKEQTFEEYYKA